MSDKKYDPNLRKAMEEIRQILQKRHRSTVGRPADSVPTKGVF